MFLHLPPHLQQLNTALVLSEKTVQKTLWQVPLLPHSESCGLLWMPHPEYLFLFYLKALVFQDICRSSLLLLLSQPL